MPTLTDRGDYGIIFYGSTRSPLPTYTDVWGQTRTAQVLADATAAMMNSAIESAYPCVGTGQKFSLQVELTLADGSSTLDLGMVGRFLDANTLPGLNNFAELVTFREDTVPPIPLAIQTLTATGKYIFQTGNLAAVSQSAVRVTPHIGEGDLDVVVRLRLVS